MTHLTKSIHFVPNLSTFHIHNYYIVSDTLARHTINNCTVHVPPIPRQSHNNRSWTGQEEERVGEEYEANGSFEMWVGRWYVSVVFYFLCGWYEFHDLWWWKDENREPIRRLDSHLLRHITRTTCTKGKKNFHCIHIVSIIDWMFL